MTKLTCDTVQPELKAYLDGMLPTIIAYRVRRHLSGCANCRRDLVEVERIGKEVHNAMSTDAGDTLDPILRARILAAIPTAPAPTRVRRQIRYRPVMAAGVLGAVLGAAVIVSQRQYSGLATHEMARSTAKGLAFDRAESGPYATASVSGNRVAAASPSASGAQRMVTPSPSLPPGSMSYSEKPAPNGGQGGSAVWASPTTENTPRVAHESDSAKTPVPVGAESKATHNGFIAGPAGVPHVFATNSLTQGVKSVSQAVAKFKGSVTGKSQTAPNTVELIVTIPANHANELLAAIPATSGGELSSEPSLSQGGRRSGGSQSADTLASPNGPANVVLRIVLVKRR
jgi:anti-sigma factor RsiW